MMESIRISYKNDAFGNPLYARVSWSQSQAKKSIAFIYHAGGYMVGSSEMIPKVQVEYLANKDFIVVIPNYRLAPQVPATEAFRDSEDAYDWATNSLPGIMRSQHNVDIDPTRTVAMGHSAGGTLAMHLASCKPVKAVTAFYPSYFNADRTTSAHMPTSLPPFGTVPDFEPTDEDWASIKPEGVQLSEAGLALPGTIPSPRSRFQMHVIKHGQWMKTVQPDENYEAIDPLARISESWPPIMMVQGEKDNIGGSGLDLARRAEKELKAAGVKQVQLEVVLGESHMFDMPPNVGTSDLGPKWLAVKRGLDWLVDHA